MNILPNRSATIAFVVALLLTSPAVAHDARPHAHPHVEILAQANTHSHGLKSEAAAGITVERAWARATPGKAPNGGAFLTIVNRGSAPDRLLSASADVSARVELHRHVDDGGIMRMRHVEAVEITVGATVAFKPGGYHVMLMGLKKPLVKGEKFPLRLRFEKAGERTVTVEVRGIGAMDGGAGHQGH